MKNRLSQVTAERDEISAERDQAYDLINLLLSDLVDSNDEEVKKKISPFKKILNKCNE